jgi:hypothetical protein
MRVETETYGLIDSPATEKDDALGSGRSLEGHALP